MTGDQIFVLALITLFLNPVVTLLTSYIIRRRDLADRAEVARKADLATNANVRKLIEVHQAVDEVGKSAVEAYKEANHANLKIQAVMDANNIQLGKPLVAVTAEALREEKAGADI